MWTAKSRWIGRIEHQLADFLGMLDVADVENDHSVVETKIEEIADRQWGPVQADDHEDMRCSGALGSDSFNSLGSPSRNFDGMSGIADVGDDENVAGIALHTRGEIDVFSSVIAVAMSAEAAGVVLPETLRMDGIGEAPGNEAVVPGRVDVGVTTALRTLETGDHLAVGDVDLNGARVLRAGEPVQEQRIGGIGDVHHGPAAVVLSACVHEPFSIRLLNGHLERDVVVHAGEADVFDVLGVGSRGQRTRSGLLSRREGRVETRAATDIKR